MPACTAGGAKTRPGGTERRMESLKRSNRWGLTAALLPLWALLWLLGGLLFMFPAVALTLPALLAWAGVKAGPVCYATLAVAAAAFMGWLLGPVFALAVALVLLPGSVWALASMDRGVPFVRAALVEGLVLLCSGGAALLLGAAYAGGDLAGALSGGLIALMRQMPQTDALLWSMYAGGLLGLPEGMEAVEGLSAAVRLTDAAREELLRSLSLYLDASLRLLLPAQWASGSIMGALLGTLLPRYAARQRGEAVDFVPLRALALPRGALGALYGTAGALLALSLLGAQSLWRALYVVWGAAVAAAGLLGLAVIDHHAHARGMRRGPRALLAVGAFALAKLLHLDLALAGVGLLDELLGLRGQKKIKFPPQGGDDGEDDLDP